MTHQAPANNWLSLFSRMVSVVERFCLCDGQTDTMCENNDHLFAGRGLVGKYYIMTLVGLPEVGGFRLPRGFRGGGGVRGTG